MACRNSNCSSNNSSGSTPDDDDDQWLWRRRSGPSTPPSYEKNGTAPSTTMSSSSPDSPPLPSPYMRRTSAAAKPQRPPAHPFDERRVHNTINGRCTNTATTTNNRNVSLSMDDADDDECKDDIAAHLLAPSSSSSSCKMTTPSTTTTVAIRNPYATATSSSTFQKISNARLFIPQQQQPTTCPTTISSTGSSWSGLSPTHQEQQQPYNNTKNTKNNNSDTAAASVWDGLPVRHNLSNKERHVAAMMCMPDPTMVQFYKALLSHHSVLDYVASSSSEPKTASAAANRLWQSLCQRLELFDSAPPPTFGIESRYHHSSASTTANHNNNINDSTHNTNTNNNNNMMMHFTSRAILLVEEIRFCMAQKLGKRWKPASTPPTTATITDPRGRGVVERSSRTVVRKKRNAAELEDHLSRHFRPHPMNNDDDWLDRHLEQHLTQHHRQCMDEEDHDSSNDDDDDGDDCVSLPRTTTALPPPVYTDVVDAGTVSMEVTLETVTPILESTQRSNRKQNGNNDKFMLTFQSTKDHRKSPHCKWPIYFLPRELEHLREGEIVECLPNTTPSRWHRNNNHHHQRTIFRSILGCVISNPQSHGGSSNAAIRSFNVVVFGPPQDHRGAGDWIVRPVHSCVSHYRQFVALTTYAKTIPFLPALLGGKNTTPSKIAIRNEDDGPMKDDSEKTAPTTSSSDTPSNKESVAKESDRLRIPPLNKNQHLAVDSFMNSEPNSITIVQGPPGTGKTSLLVATICTWFNRHLVNLEDSRGPLLAVCAPTNKAVNVLVERFAKQSTQSGIIIAIVGSPELLLGAKPKTNSLYKSCVYTWQSMIVEQIRGIQKFIGDCKRQRAKLQFTTVQKDILGRLGSIPSEFKQQMEQLGQALQYDSYEVIGECLRAFHDEFQKLDGKALRYDLMKSSHIIFCTLCSSGSNLMRQVGGVNTLIVDEAAAATEPDIYIPFHLKPNRLLIVGDPKQLPAIVLSDRARQGKLDVSLHERLMTHCGASYIMLNKQYRMHPSICSFPSNKFYQGKLLNGPNVESPYYRDDELLFDGQPFLFLHRDGQEESATCGSVRNSVEANAVVDLVRKVTRRNNPDRLRIITFYTAQVTLIRNQLEKNGFSNVLVATVDSSQGCEADIVLVSFVRSRTVGFLNDDRRMNVALTRARHQLICIGNIKSYPSFKNAHTIQAVAKHAHENDVVVSSCQSLVGLLRQQNRCIPSSPDSMD